MPLLSFSVYTMNTVPYNCTCLSSILIWKGFSYKAKIKFDFFFSRNYCRVSYYAFIARNRFSVDVKTLTKQFQFVNRFSIEEFQIIFSGWLGVARRITHSTYTSTLNPHKLARWIRKLSTFEMLWKQIMRNEIFY